MKNAISRLLFAVAMIFLLTSTVWAGGFYLYEIASPDVGLASAGYAARAQDASTVFTNPAGMTRLDRPELEVGLEPVYLRPKFGPDANTSATNFRVPDGTPGGGTQAANGNASGLVPAGSIFYVHKISDELAAGFGVFGFFGLSMQYEDNWVGRYYGTKVTLQGLTLMPALAYRVSDKVSVGAGLNAMYAMLDEKAAVNNRGPLQPFAADGTMEIKDNVWGYGGKFGVLYEPQKGTRVGLTYLTKTELGFTVTPTVNNVRPALATVLTSLSIDMTVRAPQQVILSVYQDLTDKWAIMGDVGWENWQQFGLAEIAATVDETGSTAGDVVNAHYQNTWHVALGAQCKLSDPWKISFGGAYDSSMVDGANRTPTVPIGAQWRFGAGAQYAMSQTTTLSGGYEYIWMGNLPLNTTRGPLAGTVSGEYNNTYIQILTVLLNWKM